MARKKPTPGEALFEEYLKSQNLSDFEYEKERPGKQKKPDYSVVIAGREYLFDVKDFDYVDLPPEGGFNPYKRIRGKIGEARQQFNEFQGWPCCIVLYNNNAPLLQLNRPHVVLGAMEGNFGITMLYDTREGGGMVPRSKRPAFLGGGKMIQPHWSEPQNTRISALITVRKLYFGKRRVMNEYRMRIRNGSQDPFSHETELGFDAEESG